MPETSSATSAPPHMPTHTLTAPPATHSDLSASARSAAAASASACAILHLLRIRGVGLRSAATPDELSHSHARRATPPPLAALAAVTFLETLAEDASDPSATPCPSAACPTPFEGTRGPRGDTQASPLQPGPLPELHTQCEEESGGAVDGEAEADIRFLIDQLIVPLQTVLDTRPLS